MDVQVADYLNSGKTTTAKSNQKQTAKVLEFPKRTASRKAVSATKIPERTTLKIAA